MDFPAIFDIAGISTQCMHHPASTLHQPPGQKQTVDLLYMCQTLCKTINSACGFTAQAEETYYLGLALRIIISYCISVRNRINSDFIAVQTELSVCVCQKKTETAENYMRLVELYICGYLHSDRMFRALRQHTSVTARCDQLRRPVDIYLYLRRLGSPKVHFSKPDDL